MGVINLGILVKKIMSKISGAGYIKDTDYASSSKGGTIKVDSTYATEVTSGGKLKAKEITAEAYSEANDAAFISKATLDNVLAGHSGGGSIDELYYNSTGSAAPQTSPCTLSKSSADYKFLIVVIKYSNTYATHVVCCIPQNVEMRTAGADVSNTAGVFPWKYTANGTSLSVTGGSSNVHWWAVYGVK